MTDLYDAEGATIRADCRIFHRAGLPGTHHLEEGVRFILDEELPTSVGDDEAILLLHPDEMDTLYESYVPLLDGMTVPRDDPTTHPQVAAVEVEE